MFLNGADLFVYCHEVMLCKSSGEYSEVDITWLLIIGCDHSVIPKGRRLIEQNGNGTERERSASDLCCK